MLAYEPYEFFPIIPRMFRWSINLFRIGGIQLAVHSSFLILILAVAWEGARGDGLEGAFYALSMLLSFFICVVLHELGHCLVALRCKIRVPRILLLPIGGMAEFERIPRDPKQEIGISLAGPAVNLIILWFLALFTQLPDDLFEPDSWSTPGIWDGTNGFLLQLMLVNAVMASFNLIPVFPMDGGRVLRAFLATRMPYVKATFWAALVAKVVGGLLLLLCLWLHAWLPSVLFAFILFVGEKEYRAVKRSEEAELRWQHTMKEIAESEPPKAE